jgi:hypothetical protein
VHGQNMAQRNSNGVVRNGMPGRSWRSCMRVKQDRTYARCETANLYSYTLARNPDSVHLYGHGHAWPRLWIASKHLMNPIWPATNQSAAADTVRHCCCLRLVQASPGGTSCSICTPRFSASKIDRLWTTEYEAPSSTFCGHRLRTTKRLLN